MEPLTGCALPRRHKILQYHWLKNLCSHLMPSVNNPFYSKFNTLKTTSFTHLDPFKIPMLLQHFNSFPLLLEIKKINTKNIESILYISVCVCACFLSFLNCKSSLPVISLVLSFLRVADNLSLLRAAIVIILSSPCMKNSRKIKWRDPIWLLFFFLSWYYSLNLLPSILAFWENYYQERKLKNENFQVQLSNLYSPNLIFSLQRKVNVKEKGGKVGKKIYKCVYIHIYYIYRHTHTQTHIYMYMYVYVYVYVCMCTHINKYIHT